MYRIGRVDEVGRVVIPKKMRYKLSINDGDLFEVKIDERAGKQILIVKKYYRGCVFCGVIEDCIIFKNQLVCRKCIDEIFKISELMN